MVILLISSCSGIRVLDASHSLGHTAEPPSSRLETVEETVVDVFKGIRGSAYTRRVPTYRPDLSRLPYTPDGCPAEPGIIPLLEALLKRHGSSADLSALPWVESSYNVGDYSRVGAAGPWQFMSGTARFLRMVVNDEVDQRYSWTASTKHAAEYLDYLLDRFDDWHLALAAYNCGEGTLQRAISRSDQREYGHLSLPRETTAFVPRYSAALEALQQREEEAPVLSAVMVPPGLDLRLLAAEAGIPPDQMARFNRGFLREVTPVGQRNWEVVVPSEKAALVFQAAWSIDRSRYLVRHGDNWASVAAALGVSVSDLQRANGSSMPSPGSYMALPESGRIPVNAAAAEGAGFYHYTVRSGDTLSGIGAIIGVSSREVASWNDMSTSALIHPGQKLLLRGVPPEGAVTVQIVSEGGGLVHTVGEGDTMWDLAIRYGVSVEQILLLNDKQSSALSIGENLIIRPE